MIATLVSRDGLIGAVVETPDDEAVVVSEVTLTSETDFPEADTIAFSDDHRLRFSIVGSGDLGPSAGPVRKHGAVIWRVDGGEGQFVGARRPDHVHLLRLRLGCALDVALVT